MRPSPTTATFMPASFRTTRRFSRASSGLRHPTSRFGLACQTIEQLPHPRGRGAVQGCPLFLDRHLARHQIRVRRAIVDDLAKDAWELALVFDRDDTARVVEVVIAVPV